MRESLSIAARMRPAYSLRGVGAAALVLGLALQASARDGAAISPSTPAGAAATHRKPRKWYQVGVASWYGAHFQGRKTADGERFDMNLMTCAHPSLPLGTWLRVTNLRNRRTAFVRVNDRGPLLDDRIVDLSYAAARTLGLAGTGKVRLETVRESDPELTAALLAPLQIPLLLNPISH